MHQQGRHGGGPADQVRSKSESDKDLEILLLRRLLAIYERKQARPFGFSSEITIRNSVRHLTRFFCTEGMDVIPIPYRAPNANAHAEPWIRPAREKCLDKLLIINQAHVRRVMCESIVFYIARPHQGID
jgi:hypothetical protein